MLQKDLFSEICEIPSLYRAWRKVRANKGSAGIDEICWRGFEQNLDANLSELARNLRCGTYQPLPARFVLIAKANGKMRELGILTIRDRVAQRAVLDAIEPVFEPEMHDTNFAFRPARSVETAIQRVILHRAAGAWWTVESDVQNYFAEIDCQMLLADLKKNIADEKLLALIKQWLDAGILQTTDAEAEKTWWQVSQENLANLKNLLGETVGESLDEFLAQKLGAVPYETDFPDYTLGNPDIENPLSNDRDVAARIGRDEKSAKSRFNRRALKKVLESGLIYALSNRALLGKMLSLKALGIGGAVVGAGLLAPKIYEMAKDYRHRSKGILQGAPVSPLLANVYLTAFDRATTAKGFRLVRYCDDFVLACESKEEAARAVKFVEGELKKRGLRLHPDKTRVVPPSGEFEFLGYQFLTDGSVMPPPSVPQQIGQKIRQMSLEAVKKAGQQTDKLKTATDNAQVWRKSLSVFKRKENDD